ncbi:hypothetical protein TPY_2668 [Sulfobacillus acidophilus TPY]|uniref:Uncharacterized protein n=1 Tax=Sulfobacillus acidophilus (strain ATCC 700253 / DSM 10332 / NAL) TaxID=679936 RepID=G8TV73_SULAD|nr:hypothetical protein TPY_2668 [Sulfobacillus acidophilus TPY]AEW04713.1 hypothetical protein Sulac_1213 [Sulfobacillus acidophilus DSM 10332]
MLLAIWAAGAVATAIFIVPVVGLAGWILGAVGLFLFTAWMALDGPSRWWRYRQWRRRRSIAPSRLDGPAGWDAGLWPAQYAADPVAKLPNGAVQSWAVITAPQWMLLGSADIQRWHQAIQTIIRIATQQDLWIDIITGQQLGSPWLPATPMTPLMQARWQFWASTSNAMVVSYCWVRLTAWQSDRNQAWPRFQAVAQAWAALTSDMAWHWLSGEEVQRTMRMWLDPARAYSEWRAQVDQRFQGVSSEGSRPRRVVTLGGGIQPSRKRGR